MRTLTVNDGQDLRPDAQDDGAVEGARRDERLRHEARRLLPVEELGRRAFRRAGRVRHGDGRHRGDVLDRTGSAASSCATSRTSTAARSPGELIVFDTDLETGKTETIDCTRFGSGAYSIPSLVEHLTLRDQGQVHPVHRDRRHVPAAAEPQVLEEGALHPGLDGRRADARHAPLRAPAVRPVQAAGLRLRRLRSVRDLEHLPHAQGRLGQRRAHQPVLLRAAGVASSA